MFIEQNNSKYYLTKKVGNKKLSISLDSKKITENHIKELSNKESLLLFSLSQYKQFTKDLYNISLFRKLITKEVYSYNMYTSTLSTPLKKKYDYFPIHFIYESNRTEGSKIPYSEVEKIYNEKKYSYKVKNEIKEVENSFNARSFIKDKFLFNETHIKKIYHILTKDLLQENGLKYPRGFKKVKNVVNNSPTTPPEKVSYEINKLLTFYKKNKNILSPLQLAFDFHLTFQKIHPFENGNGRIGRLLMNKILLAHNFLPFVIFSANRESYFKAIKSTEEGNKKKYYTFMLEQYYKSLLYFSK